jgi:hypothetical protein
VHGPDQIGPADMGVAAPPPGFIPLPEGLPVTATTSVAQSIGVDTSQPPPLRPPEGGLPTAGLPGIPAGMPGTITGVPPPGALPMVSPFALPSVPRKLRLIPRGFLLYILVILVFAWLMRGNCYKCRLCFVSKLCGI